MKLISRFVSLVAVIVFGLGAGALPSAAQAANPKLQIPETDDGLPGKGPIRRQDWFKKTWMDRRTKWAQSVEKDQKAVVFLGDSITQGWGDNMGNSFSGMKVANRGISGDTTRGVLIRLKEDVLDLNPTAVVILIGTNDLEENADPAIIAGNLQLILAALKAHNPKMPVILNQVFPSSESKNRPADKIKKINDLYLAAVKGDEQVIFMETYVLFANKEGNATKEEFPDLLHPNKAGYAKWAAGIRPIFETIALIPVEADNFTPEPGFVSLFNGHDLTGWGYKTNNFDGKKTSQEGRYLAKDGRLIVTTPPEYRKQTQLWTTQKFPKNFTLKLEFRATPFADSGVFLRSPQLQCRDYLSAGPYTELKQYKPQDWNEIVVVVKDNVANCTCNGEVLEAALKLPPTGPIGLEGDRGQMEYRRLRIQETP
ncbi:MAG: multifunctional acyl-CoA thioesterase and protease and lysophospholipase [Verrucomicrobiales bacterium]|nr:multifunctional acyl-CoA thioesterase and protease and lysophospholipase [Verrucomicrobiales bacterium]